MNIGRLKSLSLLMGHGNTVPNDNKLSTPTELQTYKRELTASLKRCEKLISDCKDKLVDANAPVQPED
jgi:hypothetical protein